MVKTILIILNIAYPVAGGLFFWNGFFDGTWNFYTLALLLGLVGAIYLFSGGPLSRRSCVFLSGEAAVARIGPR